jgi:very-short-patch-repair endonuclease
MALHRMGSAGTKSGADFHWPEHGVVVEVDGIHGLPWNVTDDSGRDAALLAAGWTVLRFSARDVHERGAAVTARTVAALASTRGLPRAA